MLISRNPYKVEITKNAPDKERVERMKDNMADILGITKKEANYFIFSSRITNRAYNGDSAKINILKKNFETVDIVEASDLNTLQSLDKAVTKYILCYKKA
ncbi:MAG: hypothetical protein EOO02_11195 [Chitinophagaceae bacterium]|nr:MAG: hypothetical protein EOO02_11195 [Chitinophagaceae bacterium]